MATQGCFLLLCLAFGVTLGQNRNCFNTACGNGDSLSACVAGHWQCHHGEVCFMDIKHDSSVSMICVAANHAHCPNANHQQDASCAPLVYPPQHDCVYCCDTEQCVRNIEAGMVLAIHPPQQGCFAGLCDHHANLQSCLQGQWQCNANQFCRFEAHRNGDIIMQCQETDRLAYCQSATSKNPDTCSRLDTLPPPTDCKYCCTDQSCIVNILTSQTATTTTPTTTTTTPTPTTTTTTTPTPGHNLHAGTASCFTSDCYHVDLAQCISGQWACTAHQYCPVQGHADGTLHMNCDDIAHYDECSNHFSHNLPECQVSIHGHCQYCCNDADCVRRLASVPATQPPATTTTKSTPAPTATPAPTPTPAPTTAPTTAPTMPPATITPTPAPTTLGTEGGNCMLPDHDQCTILPDVCQDDSLSHHLCPHFCGFCDSAITPPPTTTTTPSPTTTPTPTTTTSTTTTPAATTVCEDHYAGDCSVDFAGRCGEETIGHFLCPKFCGTCNPLPCRDLFTGDCSVTFAGRCNEPAILEICRQTCGCAGPMTTTTVVPTTTTAPMTTTKVVVPTTTTDGCIDKFHGDCSVALNGLCSYEVVADLCQKTCNTCGFGSNSATTTSSNSGHLIG